MYEINVNKNPRYIADRNNFLQFDKHNSTALVSSLYFFSKVNGMKMNSSEVNMKE